MLSDRDFETIVRHTPLVSIDILVQCQESKGDVRILVGKRCNPPAKGHLFVPGGRIRKNETTSEAVVRILKDEIGIEKTMNWTFCGFDEHFYPENFTGSDDFNTHYVVLVVKIDVDHRVFHPGDSQHESFDWYDPFELRKDRDLHPYIRRYLRYVI